MDNMKKGALAVGVLAVVAAAVIMKKNGTSIQDVAEKTASKAKKLYNKAQSAVEDAFEQVKQAKLVVEKSFAKGTEVKAHGKTHKNQNKARNRA